MLTKDILGFEGLYYISNKGEVNSYFRPSHNGIRSFPSKKILPFCNGTGYLQINLTNCLGHRSKYYLHRLVWETFNHKIPKSLEIDHLDNIKTNNHITNLVLSTRKQNMSKMLNCNPHVLNNLKNHIL